jgi:hypothetical protein
MKTWWRIALLNFLIAGTLGALLRYAFVEELSWMNFRYFLHAHSHVAMLGWVYLALYGFLIPAFLNKEQVQSRFYHRLFWWTQVSVAGMLVSFPIQGYGPVSITFSTMHVLLSYLFIYRFTRHYDRAGGGRLSTWFLYAAFAGLILSTLGLWAMGPIMAGGIRGNPWYYMAVQFFLHFQFFGWFLFGAFALFFKMMETEGMALDRRLSRAFFWVLLAGALLTFALPLTWAFPSPFLFGVNSLGALLQMAALILFVQLMRRQWRKVRRLLPYWSRLFLTIAFLAFAVKALMQGLTAVPHLAVMGYTIRNFMIGFIHLVLLGVISTFLIGYAFYRHLTGNLRGRIGAGLFLIGLISSEVLLFLQGALLWGAKGFLPGYYELLFGLSALMPAGLLLILAGKLPLTSPNSAHTE